MIRPVVVGLFLCRPSSGSVAAVEKWHADRAGTAPCRRVDWDAFRPTGIVHDLGKRARDQDYCGLQLQRVAVRRT